MAKILWTQVEKKGRGVAALPPQTVSISKSVLTFSADLEALFEDYLGIEIFYNRKLRLLGLKPSNDPYKSFKLGKKMKRTITIGNYFEELQIPTGKFHAEWDAEDGKIIASLS